MFSKAKSFSAYLVTAIGLVLLAAMTSLSVRQGVDGLGLFGQILLWSLVLGVSVSLWPILEALANVRRAVGVVTRERAVQLLIDVAGKFGSEKATRPRIFVSFVRDIAITFLLLSANIIWLTVGYVVLALLVRGASDECRRARGVK